MLSLALSIAFSESEILFLRTFLLSSILSISALHHCFLALSSLCFFFKVAISSSMSLMIFANWNFPLHVRISGLAAWTLEWFGMRMKSSQTHRRNVRKWKNITTTLAVQISNYKRNTKVRVITWTCFWLTGGETSVHHNNTARTSITHAITNKWHKINKAHNCQKCKERSTIKYSMPFPNSHPPFGISSNPRNKTQQLNKKNSKSMLQAQQRNTKQTI